ncbi:hypothetical protein P175DRAFT_037236 [Aspergillus ochraceoroseus IBT 24754]|uniref:Uncharacterized protein n=1 Tax=Aspergillus ochraceoroseus IBT 24754 TaxID=1392256 RepID=A0A2T5M7F3_9EURO|nr:uncharacterized protein P175DRAFT_037236 [Aspergillus ochraceoroseus IBT 24754]PTU24469.1 hypothetical protein P175DRAFT_037236 [Aspergillus ochraceoroseus IBT 24754]
MGRSRGTKSAGFVFVSVQRLVYGVQGQNGHRTIYIDTPLLLERQIASPRRRSLLVYRIRLIHDIRGRTPTSTHWYHSNIYIYISIYLYIYTYLWKIYVDLWISPLLPF